MSRRDVIHHALERIPEIGGQGVEEGLQDGLRCAPGYEDRWLTRPLSAIRSALWGGGQDYAASVASM